MKPDLSLYAITDQKSARGRDDLQVARALLAGGATALQYRAKKVEARVQWETARKLRQLAGRAGAFFVVNDRVDLALDCGADAVHVGQDDLPLKAVRKLAGRRLKVGVSTHDLAQALRAQDEGADYIGFGPVFFTRTKERNVSARGLTALAEVCRRVRIPVVAIGGIKRRHLGALKEAGARHIAVVTALTGARDVEAATRGFKEAWIG